MISIIIPTYNASEQTLATLSALSGIAGGKYAAVEVVVVDDGSERFHREALRNADFPFVQLVFHETNRGRGAARNTGVNSTGGDKLLFLDADCRPQDGFYLDAHCACLERGNDLSLGSVTTRGNGFWARYQREAAGRRAKQFASGYFFAMTAANMMVARQWFERVGGFNTAYRGYGFEDRDLLLRLFEAGARVGFTEATAYHDADLDLHVVVRKMAEAGRTTAPLFRQAHPAAYRELGYAAIDASLKAWLAPPAHVLGKAAEMVAPLIERHIERLPFPVAAKIVKLASAAAFMSGTAATR